MISDTRSLAADGPSTDTLDDPIFAALDQGVVLIDAASNVLAISPRAEALLFTPAGVTPVIGEDVRQLIRVTSLEAFQAQTSLTLADLDREIDGSTAVAVAMSGNAFMPGHDVNLTGNIGTYNGAVAASLQLGVMLSPNAAVNVGVSTGFNKGGKTAARVGFTLGL